MKIRILLLALLTFVSGAIAQNVALDIGSSSGLAGSTVSLPIGISSSGGAQPQAVQWTFAFNPSNAVTSFTVDPGSSANSASKSISCSVTTGICIVAGFNSNVIPNGALATANIQLSGSAAGSVTVSLTSTGASDNNPIPSNGGSGTITITPPAAALSALSCSPNSFSAAGTSTCTVTLTSTAGATVALSDNSANVTTPANVIVPSGQTTAQFTATVTGVPGDETPTITASLNSVTRTAGLTLTAVPTLSSVTCLASSLSSTQSTTCTATLNKAAVGATAVSLSDSTAQLTVPATVTIANGATSNTFTVTAGTVTVNESATVTGTLNSVNRSAPINLVAPSVSSLTCTPNVFGAAGTSTCTVSLAANATANVGVTLSDNSANVTTPGSVTVNSGQSTAQFAANISSVSADETATITAALNSSSRGANLTLTSQPALTSIACPSGPFGSNQSTITCSANLNKAAVGATIVTLSDNSSQLNTPASVTIANGASSAQFNVSTGTVTVSETASVLGSLNSVTQSSQISLAPPAGLSGLSCNPTAFSVAGTSICTVTLTGNASSNTTVTLSDNSANVTTPANVTVLSGQSSAQFSSSVTGVPVDETVTITATLNGTQSATLTLTTLPALASVSCVAGSLNTNQGTTCTATLNKAAVGATAVTLSDSTGQLTTPANVTIANGLTSGQFTVTAGTITTSETAIVTGTLNSVSRSAQINLVAPAGLSGLSCSPNTFNAAGSSTCTVTLITSASSNTVITLSDNSTNVTTPVNVTVLSGQSSAQFTETVTGVPADETVTVTASLSGGTQSASLTLTTPPALISIACASPLTSNQSITCTANLNKGAVGATVVTLSDNSNQLTTPASVTIANGQTSGQFTVTAGTITFGETASVFGVLNGVTHSSQISLVAPAGLSGLNCTPNSFSAAGPSTCTVTLVTSAPSNTLITLSDNSANVTTPANVTVSSGQTSAQFTANVTGVPVNETATITASLNGGSQSANLTLTTPPALSSVTCLAGSLNSNQGTTCTATLNKAAIGATLVSLSDTTGQLNTPASVTIANAQTSNTFTVVAGTISSSETATITGSLNGVNQSAQISLIAPAGLSGLSCSPNVFGAAGTSTCTVSLASNAFSNTVVTLSDNSTNVTIPANVTVLSGQSSAQFTANVASFSSDETATITAGLNGGTQSANLTLTSGPSLIFVACGNGSLSSGQSRTCSVNLNKPAVTATLVTLSDSTTQLTAPASATIVAGQTSVTFTVTAGTITFGETASVFGTLNGVVHSAQIPLVASAGLSGLSCNPSSFTAAGTATCTVSLVTPESSNTLVTLSDNSASVTTPANVTVVSGQATAQFTATVNGVVADETVVITAALNGGTMTANLTLSGLPALSSVVCAAASLASNQNTNCTAELSKAAAGTTVVTLTDTSNQLTTPASVTIADGQTSGQFTVTAGTVATAENVTITAVLNGISRGTQIGLTSGPGQISLLGLLCSPNTLYAGQSVLCEVNVGTAVTEATLVALSSTNDSVAIPPSITIPAGANSAQFRINGPVTLADGTMTVTASKGGDTSSTSITLRGAGTPEILSLGCTPASLAAGESTLCTVTLSRTAVTSAVVTITGETIIALPAQMTIPVGSATGTFTAKVANITSAQITTLYAAYAGKQVSTVLTLTGPAVQPALQSLNCTPGTIPAGTGSFCTVTFTGRIVFPANLGIAATSNLLQVPAQLVPSVGVTSVSFPIQAGSTDREQSIVLGLTWSGSAPQSQTIIVTPQASVALDAPSVVFTRAGQQVTFDVKLVRSSSFGAQVIAPSLPEGATFQNMRFSWTPAIDTIGEHLIEIRAIDNGGSSVSSIVRVVVRAPEATIDALVNPAGFTVSSECTVNSLMTLIGRGFSLRDPEHASTLPLPTILAGVRVRINDIYAPLLHVQDDLIHFQCPQLPVTTSLQIVLEYESAPPPPNGAPRTATQSVAPIQARMGTASPGIYIVGGTQGAILENSSNLIAGPPNPDYPARPAAPGDYLVIYGNGMGVGTTSVAPGDVAPLNPLVYSTATVLVDFGDGIKVPSSFAGLAPGFIGLFQVNVQIPAGTKYGMAIPVTLEMQWPGQTLRSNTVTVAIQPR